MAVTREEIAQSLSSGILHLILLPTESCNFRCVYCYEEFRFKRMEPWVVRGVRGLIERRAPGLGVLSISWFGGEPLLARDIIEDVMAHAQSLARLHPKLAIRAGMTTNAYLLSRSLFERLLDLGITDYQISFDGPREYHDRKRVLAGGKGTFDRIWSNVLSLREVERPFDVMIRVHVDRENECAIPEFIDLYAKELGRDGRFRIFMRPLSRLGGPNDHALAVLSEQESRTTIARLRRRAAKGDLRQGPAIHAESPTEICYAARGNSFVVRANGRLNKCTVALEHPTNQVGMIHEDGSLEIQSPLMIPWMRGLGSGDRAELECPMIGLADSARSP